DHDVRLPALDDAERIAQRVCAGRARGYGTVVRAAYAETHGNQPRRDVRDEHRHEEGADPLRPSLEERLRLLLERRDPADPAADHDADPVTVEVVEPVGESGVAHRLVRDGDRELSEPVRPADLLAVHVLVRLEALD